MEATTETEAPFPKMMLRQVQGESASRKRLVRRVWSERDAIYCAAVRGVPVFDADTREVSVLSVRAPLFPIVLELVRFAGECVVVLVISSGAPEVVRLPVPA